MKTMMTTGEKMIWAAEFVRGVDETGVGGAASRAFGVVEAARRCSRNPPPTDGDERAENALAMIREMVAPEIEPLAAVQEHINSLHPLAEGKEFSAWYAKLRDLVGAKP